MKRSIFILLLMLFSWQLRAQTNAAEAKAAYLLAEESYARGDYGTSLQFLDKARESLGSTNCKLLYLQIQNQQELYKADPSYYSKLLASIADFESAPDVQNFNQEKVLEVMKLKLQIEAHGMEQQRLAAEEAARKQARQQAFSNFGPKGWPLNVSFADLQKQKHDDPFFAEPLDDVEDKRFNMTMYFLPEIKNYSIKVFAYPFVKLPSGAVLGTPFRNESMYGILVKNGIVKGYAATLFVHRSWDKNETLTYQQALAKFNAVIEQNTALFGFKPVYSKVVNGYHGTLNNYTWEVAGKKVVLQSDNFTNTKNWQVQYCMYVLVE